MQNIKALLKNMKKISYKTSEDKHNHYGTFYVSLNVFELITGV